MGAGGKIAGDVVVLPVEEGVPLPAVGTDTLTSVVGLPTGEDVDNFNSAHVYAVQVIYVIYTLYVLPYI